MKLLDPQDAAFDLEREPIGISVGSPATVMQGIKAVLHERLKIL